MTEYLLPFPMKVAEGNTDWRLVNKYIKSNYPDSKATGNVAGAFDKMNEMRKQIANVHYKSKNALPTESYLEMMLKPYVQHLFFAQAHVPICSGEIKNFNFTWKDCWDETKRTSSNSNVEIVSCLINCAASYSYLASTEVSLHCTVESIKNAFKLYQQAAGIYQLILRRFSGKLPTNEQMGDLSTEFIQLLLDYSLALAHHCAYLKAEKELTGQKHLPLLAKMALDAERLYSGVATSVKGFPRGSLVYMTYPKVAMAIFHAKAHAHLGVEKMQAEELGEAVGRFHSAMDSLNPVVSSVTRDSPIFGWLNSQLSKVSELLAKAQNMNDTVYFARILRNQPLPDPLNKPMGKATDMTLLLPQRARKKFVSPVPPHQGAESSPTNALPTESESTALLDPFQGIVPLHVLTIANDFKSKMQQQVQEAGKTVQAHRDKVRKAMNDLGIVAALEAVASEEKTQGRVPDILRRKILQQRTDANGKTFKIMDVLINMITHSANLAEAARVSLRGLTTALDHEETEDNKLRADYGEKIWSGLRQPSAQLPDVMSFRKAVKDIANLIDGTVVQPLEIVKQVLNDSLREITRLDWPIEDLDALMPYTKGKAAKEFSNETMINIERLKGVVSSIDQTEQDEGLQLRNLQELLQSDALVQQLSSVPPDQQASVMDEVENEFAAQIGVITHGMSKADELLETAQSVMITLAQVQSNDPIAEEIQRLSNSLESACSLYQSLQNQLGDVASTALTLMEKAESTLALAEGFTTGRSLEAQDFKQSLETQLQQKMQEMNAKKQSEEQTTHSRQRQEELQAQIKQLEMQQQMREKQKETQMQEMLRKQQEATVAFTQAHPNANPPPPPYSPPAPDYMSQQQAQAQQQNMADIFAPRVTPQQQAYHYPGDPQQRPPPQATYAQPMQQQPMFQQQQSYNPGYIQPNQYQPPFPPPSN